MKIIRRSVAFDWLDNQIERDKEYLKDEDNYVVAEKESLMEYIDDQFSTADLIDIFKSHFGAKVMSGYEIEKQEG